MAHVSQKLALRAVRMFGSMGRLTQRSLVLLTLRDFTHRSEHALQSPIPIVQGGRVVGYDCLLAVPVARGQLVIGDFSFAQRQTNARLGALGVGEERFEWRAYQLVARAASERLHLLVDVSDDAGGVGGHQCVDI